MEEPYNVRYCVAASRYIKDGTGRPLNITGHHIAGRETRIERPGGRK